MFASIVFCKFFFWDHGFWSSVWLCKLSSDLWYKLLWPDWLLLCKKPITSLGTTAGAAVTCVLQNSCSEKFSFSSENTLVKIQKFVNSSKILENLHNQSSSLTILDKWSLYIFPKNIRKLVVNKAKGRITKRVLPENKHAKFSEKQTFLTPLIRLQLY